MKNNVMGKKITRNYYVSCERNDDGSIKRKPYLLFKDGIEWANILSFEGNNTRANKDAEKSKSGSYIDYLYKMNISEDEEVKVEKDIFRADLNEMMIYTSKEILIIDSKKEEAEEELKTLISKYNKQEIEKDEKLLSYCKLHKLNIEDLELEELKKIVYSNESDIICNLFSNLTSFNYNNYCTISTKEDNVTII